MIVATKDPLAQIVNAAFVSIPKPTDSQVTMGMGEIPLYSKDYCSCNAVVLHDYDPKDNSYYSSLLHIKPWQMQQDVFMYLEFATQSLQKMARSTNYVNAEIIGGSQILFDTIQSCLRILKIPVVGEYCDGVENCDFSGYRHKEVLVVPADNVTYVSSPYLIQQADLRSRNLPIVGPSFLN